MIAQVSWFVLFVARIVTAEHTGPEFIPDCKYVVEAPGIKMSVNAHQSMVVDASVAEPKSVSGIYVFLPSIRMRKGNPVMALTQKIAVTGKQNFKFDENATVPVHLKWSTLNRERALRFIVRGIRTVLIVQAEEHFCIRRESEAHQHWAIYNESLKEIVGWSSLVDETTGVACNPDVGLLSYIPPSEDNVDYEPFELPTFKVFMMAYECVTYMKTLEEFSGIASNATAASLDVGRNICRYWNQSHRNLLFASNESTDGVCFLEDSTTTTRQAKTAPVLGEMLSAFSGCVVVAFGLQDYSGPYLMDMSSLQMNQRAIEENGLLTVFGHVLSNQLIYSPNEGRMTFKGQNIYFEVDEFPCKPGQTAQGPFAILNSDSTSTNNEVMVYSVTSDSSTEVKVYYVRSPLDYFMRCWESRGNDLGCSSGVTYQCQFGQYGTRQLKTCIH